MLTFEPNWNDVTVLTENGKYPDNGYIYRLVDEAKARQLIDSITLPPPIKPAALTNGKVTKGLHQQKKPVTFHEEFHITVAMNPGSGSYHLFVKVLEPLPGQFYDLQAVGYSTTPDDRLDFEGSLVKAVIPIKWKTAEGSILKPDKWVW